MRDEIPKAQCQWCPPEYDPRPYDHCCDDALAANMDGGAAGGVLCCRGRVEICVWMANVREQNPTARRIIEECVKMHEATHVDDINRSQGTGN